MGRLRLYLITALAFLLEVLVLLWFPVAGVRPRVLPRWCVWWGWSRTKIKGLNSFICSLSISLIYCFFYLFF